MIEFGVGDVVGFLIGDDEQAFVVRSARKRLMVLRSCEDDTLSIVTRRWLERAFADGAALHRPTALPAEEAEQVEREMKACVRRTPRTNGCVRARNEQWDALLQRFGAEAASRRSRNRPGCDKDKAGPLKSHIEGFVGAPLNKQYLAASSQLTFAEGDEP